MPTLSEINERAADAEHQAFQQAYDALLDIAKDPITCRHFWDAGRLDYAREHEQELAIAYIDGHARGRESLRIELERQAKRQWPTEPEIMALGDECQHFLVCDADGYVALVNDVIAKFARPMPPPDVRELVEALESFPEDPNPYTYRMAHAKARAALAKFGGGV